MKTFHVLAVVMLAACAQTETQPEAMTGRDTMQTPADAPDVVLILTGDVESPPVSTTATGRALILVNDDGTIGGVIEAPGMTDSTAAIEDDAADADGPVVVMLVPAGDGRWQVPAGTRLTPKQHAHYKSGKLYANVRSKAHPKGEVRAQLQGNSRAKAKDAAASSAASK